MGARSRPAKEPDRKNEKAPASLRAPFRRLSSISAFGKAQIWPNVRWTFKPKYASRAVLRPVPRALAKDPSNWYSV